MNNHQKSTFYQLGNFLNLSLSPTKTRFKKFPIQQKLNSANHPYLCKGLHEYKIVTDYINYIHT